MKFPLRSLSPLAICLCEFLGLLALFLVPELDKFFILAAVGAGLAASAFRLKLPDRALLIILVVLVFSALGAGAFGSFAIGAVLSKSMIPMHAFLWVAGEPKKYRFWRLGISFLEIVLAAILSPETHMFLIIFGFILLAALALSFSFLQKNFEVEDPAALDRPVNSSFLGAVIVSAFLIFLSSLLIFPLLPRSNWTGLGNSWSEPGYTEVVSFQGNTLSWGSGNSRPMVWVFLPPGARWQEIVPYGLLRGKVLESFDGTEWRSASKQLNSGKGFSAGQQVEIFREPMQTDILPVPYGVSGLQITGTEKRKYLSGEWPAPIFRNRRVQYHAFLGPADQSADLPKKIHLRRVDAKTFPGLVKLATELKKGAKTDEERIKNVMRQMDRYKASLSVARAEASETIHPVERFLLETKEGHCELFATAAALIFREMGMPSRLVAGFRGSLPNGTVFSVKNTDAHAWIEVWAEGRGWVSLDPTPIILSSSTWPEIFTNAYELINAYWHRYILGYEFDPRAFFFWARHQRISTPLILGIFFVLAILAWRIWPRKKKLAEPERLRITRAWRALEKRAKRGAEDFWLTNSGRSLRTQYLELRFGRIEPEAGVVDSFAAKGKVAIKEFFAAKESAK